jgi:hypothetical protein
VVTRLRGADSLVENPAHRGGSSRDLYDASPSYTRASSGLWTRNGGWKDRIFVGQERQLYQSPGLEACYSGAGLRMRPTLTPGSVRTGFCAQENGSDGGPIRRRHPVKVLSLGTSAIWNFAPSGRGLGGRKMTCDIGLKALQIHRFSPMMNLPS